MVLLSKAIFWAVRSIVILWAVVGTDIGVGLGVGVGVGVDEHAARTDRVIDNIKTKRYFRLTDEITLTIFLSEV